MWIGTHAALAHGRQLGQFRLQAALGVEQFLRAIALQPVFQQLEVFGMVDIHGNGHLVGAEGAFDLLAIDPFRAGPALRRSENDHGPARAREVGVDAGLVLNASDLLDDPIECRAMASCISAGSSPSTK